MWSLLEFFPEDFQINILDVGAALSERPPYQTLVEIGRGRSTRLRLQVRRTEVAGCAEILDSCVDVSARKLVQSKVIADDVVTWIEIAGVHVMVTATSRSPNSLATLPSMKPGHRGIRLKLRSPFKVGPRRFRTDSLPLPQTFVDQFAGRHRCSLRRGRGSLLDGCACCSACAGRWGCRSAPGKRRSGTSQKPPEDPTGFAFVAHWARTSCLSVTSSEMRSRAAMKPSIDGYGRSNATTKCR
jgi:hypothetical protein